MISTLVPGQIVRVVANKILAGTVLCKRLSSLACELINAEFAVAY